MDRAITMMLRWTCCLSISGVFTRRAARLISRMLGSHSGVDMFSRLCVLYLFLGFQLIVALRVRTHSSPILAARVYLWGADLMVKPGTRHPFSPSSLCEDIKKLVLDLHPGSFSLHHTQNAYYVHAPVSTEPWDELIYEWMVMGWICATLITQVPPCIQRHSRTRRHRHGEAENGYMITWCRHLLGINYTTIHPIQWLGWHPVVGSGTIKRRI